MKFSHTRKNIESIEFVNVDFHFESSPLIFADVNYQFPLNETVVFTSSEVGQGGSTLMQLLAGLMPTSKGQFLINGQNVNEMSFEEFLPFRLAIGYSFDFGGLLHNRTLLENLTLPLLYHKVYPESEARKHALEFMQRMNIDRHQGQRPSVVQGSVRKMICMLRPLLMNPDLLLLDDPSVGLSPESVNAYWDLLTERQRAGHLKSLYICSRDEHLIADMAYRRIEIKNQVLHDCGQQNSQCHIQTAVG